MIAKSCLPFCSSIYEGVQFFCWHPWVKSLRHSTILRFWLKICLLFFDRIGQCCQIRKMVPRYCILPAFFIKCQNWLISIRYTKNQIIVRTHQLEKPASHQKTSNMFKNPPLKCACNVLTFKWANVSQPSAFWPMSDWSLWMNYMHMNYWSDFTSTMGIQFHLLLRLWIAENM